MEEGAQDPAVHGAAGVSVNLRVYFLGGKWTCVLGGGGGGWCV